MLQTTVGPEVKAGTTGGMEGRRYGGTEGLMDPDLETWTDSELLWVSYVVGGRVWVGGWLVGQLWCCCLLHIPTTLGQQHGRARAGVCEMHKYRFHQRVFSIQNVM